MSDDDRQRELWNSGVEAWFPDGPDSADIVLRQVEGDSAQYWDTRRTISTALSFAKAKATGEPYSGGENEKVEL